MAKRYSFNNNLKDTVLDTTRHKLSSAELHELKRFGRTINKFDANFGVFDAHNDLVLLSECDKFKSDPEYFKGISKSVLNKKSKISQFGSKGEISATVLTSGFETIALVGIIDTGDKRSNLLEESTRPEIVYLNEMLSLFAESFCTLSKCQKQIEIISAELSQTYEEIMLLHKLGTNMNITKSDINFLQIACDSLTEIVSVEGMAIFSEKVIDGNARLVLAAGSGLIDVDERMIVLLQSRLMEEINNGKEALLDSDVDSPFKYDWPDNIKNIIAVPLLGKNKSGNRFPDENIIGIMVAANIIDKSDFDSSDIKLFNSVANSCAVFVENGKLFDDLKELFIGSLKSLTSIIDAKDEYTRGHSERVAFISRWIAERLTDEFSLEEEQIHKVYLAGLLHDIGKLGIEEVVLRKKGRLNTEEFDRIKKHPSIGAGILDGIKQMRDIVPGVLYHHERIDGKGYPYGLVGEQLPLMGKIIQIADCFDAMTSKRTYRSEMTIEKALEEIKKGLGTQFDENVGRVFINSDIYCLWDIIQDGLTESYGTSNFSEYGTIAVGTLVR